MQELAELVHDFKNPLATIALEMSWLQEKLGDQQPELRSVFARVTRNVAFLDRLVHDILDVSAHDENCLELRLSRAALGPLLEDVVERAISSHDRPRVFIDIRESTTATLDSIRIQRVIANLLTNALKYSPAMCNVVVRLELEDFHARVSVIDTGPGILPEDLSTIFDRRFRSIDTRTLEGTGLGLYVCKRIIEAHHGSIGVLSTRGAGSCFFFEIPAV